MNSNNVLAYLAIKFNGDWNKVYHAIKFKEVVNLVEVEQVISECKNKFITILDEEYPDSFKNIYRPPMVLFYKGDISLLNNKRILGVVGTRNPSDYGIYAAKKVIRETDQDIVIVSGLAKGIDSIAHETAIETKKKTIAFLGCGINYIYPTENYQLYKDIEENGLILSEYPDMTPPDKENFPFRNRLIAGLSKGVLAVEAKNKSGTSTTITSAAAFGKLVLAIPSPIDDEDDSLCNALIRDGAVVVTSGKDINEEI
jgi:DNA processing protein